MEGEAAGLPTGVDARGATGVQVGDGNVQINVFAHVHSPARSAYLHQVQAIAPKVLKDRESELAELSDFCTRPDTGERTDYMWLRAQAWAGKTALMSSFALNPPPGTRIVSFFITSRFAAQGDREAYLDVVIEQLATLLGEPMPPYLTDATRAAHLWQMLDAAASACEQRGQRLILLVDGLDEDSGATGHSIAALLPARPAAGLRVVVSGRHDPPLPSDVPSAHPLRDPAVVHVLTASPHAQVVRHGAQLELKRLLRGTAAEQDLLGLITAAGGGLSGRDLAELTGSQGWEIEEALHAVVGRTFTRQPTRVVSTAATEVYVLGHEELQRSATDFLGDARLEGYRQRLHSWADGYRRAKWPAETPVYLLLGYGRMLHAHADVTRLVECALDKARHERMLVVSGGDAASLAEIALTQDAILGRSPPDLRAMVLLTVHRDDLIQRNANIPSGLPAVWAHLGHPLRAEALAGSIPAVLEQLRAWTELTRALAVQSTQDGEASPGHMDVRVAEAMHQAEALARKLPSAYAQAVHLAEVAKIAAEVGGAEHHALLLRDAEAVARTIPTPYHLVQALLKLAMHTLRVGDFVHFEDLVHEAEAAAEAVSDEDEQKSVRASVALAKVVGEAGNPTAPLTKRSARDAVRFAALVRDAEAAAREDLDIQAMTMLATAVREAGDTARFTRLLFDAEAVARGPDGLGKVAEAWASAGYADRAETVVRSIGSPPHQARYLATVTAAIATTGDVVRAENVARTITETAWRARALVAVAGAASRAGHIDRAEGLVLEAEAMARTVAEPDDEVREWVAMAGALGDADDVDRAEAVARIVIETESIGLYYDFRRESAQALARVAGALARAGALPRALAVVRTIIDSFQYVRAGAEVAGAAVRVGQADRAAELLRQTTRVARLRANPYERAQALVVVAHAFIDAADEGSAAELLDEAEAAARAERHLIPRARAAVEVATALLRTGEEERAAELLAKAEDAIRALGHSYPGTLALAEMATLLIRAGDTDRAGQFLDEAEQAAWTLTDPYQRARALWETAEGVATTGDMTHFGSLILSAQAVATSVTSTISGGPDNALTEIVEVVARVGDTDRAEGLARTINEPKLRARALAAVGLHSSDAQASLLIAQALRLGGYQPCIRALGAAAPHVLAVVVDELLARRAATPHL